MASASDFSNIRTAEDIINALNIIYFNLNEIERTYYDMFVNPIPLDVSLQRYNDQGILETIVMPNRAKDTQSGLSGAGAPNGVVSARMGTLYIDTNDASLYYKSTGSDSSGWVQLWSVANLIENSNFLSPTGDGSRLTNINMSNVGSGVLAVSRGGTGTRGVTGIVKGNGDSAYTAAVDGVDFIGPSTMAGLIAFYPVNNIPQGWLRADGAAYSRTTYANLFKAIGTTYGAGNGTTTFNVPNLINYYVRCWDGVTPFNTVQQDQVGKHKHIFNGSTADESAHTHTRGTMDITGTGIMWYTGNAPEYKAKVTGALYVDESVPPEYKDVNDAASAANAYPISFKASKAWSGATSKGSAHRHTIAGETENNDVGNSDETRVLSKMLVPVIKY